MTRSQLKFRLRSIFLRKSSRRPKRCVRREPPSLSASRFQFCLSSNRVAFVFETVLARL